MINHDQYSDPTATDDKWDEELRTSKQGGEQRMRKEQCTGCKDFKEYEHWAKTVHYPHGQGTCCRLYCKKKMMCISKVQDCYENSNQFRSTKGGEG